MSSLDQDKVISAGIELTMVMQPGQSLYAQLGMLYTDRQGVRKFRILNYQWIVAETSQSYYESIDVSNLA